MHRQQLPSKKVLVGMWEQTSAVSMASYRLRGAMTTSLDLRRWALMIAEALSSVWSSSVRSTTCTIVPLKAVPEGLVRAVSELLMTLL